VTVTGTAQRLLDDLQWPRPAAEGDGSSDATTTSASAAHVASAPTTSAPTTAAADSDVAASGTVAGSQVHTFEGSFTQAESTGGAHSQTVHVHTLEIPEPTTIEVRLQISPDSIQIMGGSTMDLYVAGAAEGSSSDLLTSDHRMVFKDAVGTLEMTVDPYLITDPMVGYILTVTTGYEFPKTSDPSLYHTDEAVTLLLDGEVLDSQAIRTRRGEVQPFTFSAALPDGNHTLTLQWTDRHGVVAAETITVTAGAPDGSDDAASVALPATGGGAPVALALLLLTAAAVSWRGRQPA
jgi:hypothetical protein